jgi:hypothetical protein
VVVGEPSPDIPPLDHEAAGGGGRSCDDDGTGDDTRGWRYMPNDRSCISRSGRRERDVVIVIVIVRRDRMVLLPR